MAYYFSDKFSSLLNNAKSFVVDRANAASNYAWSSAASLANQYVPAFLKKAADGAFTAYRYLRGESEIQPLITEDQLNTPSPFQRISVEPFLPPQPWMASFVHPQFLMLAQQSEASVLPLSSLSAFLLDTALLTTATSRASPVGHFDGKPTSQSPSALTVRTVNDSVHEQPDSQHSLSSANAANLVSHKASDSLLTTDPTQTFSSSEESIAGNVSLQVVASREEMIDTIIPSMERKAPLAEAEIADSIRPFSSALEEQIANTLLEQAAIPREILQFREGDTAPNRYRAGDSQPRIVPTWTSSLAQVAAKSPSRSQPLSESNSTAIPLAPIQRREAQKIVYSADSLPSIRHSSLQPSSILSLNSSSFAPSLHPFAWVQKTAQQSSEPVYVQSPTVEKQQGLSVDSAPVKQSFTPPPQPIFVASVTPLDIPLTALHREAIVPALESFAEERKTQERESVQKGSEGAERKKAEEVASREIAQARAQTSEYAQQKAREQAVLSSGMKTSSEAAMQLQAQEESAREREEAERNRREEAYYKRATSHRSQEQRKPLNRVWDLKRYPEAFPDV